jgi:YihY family inner membrane protein
MMAGQHTPGRPEASQREQQARSDGLKDRAKPFLHFWQKLSNDWVFNLSGLLAYNLLMSIFPILLAMLAVAGLVLNNLAPGSERGLLNAIANALPGGSAGTGGTIVRVAMDNLQRQAGLLFIIGLLTSIFTGSRLFITLENCFGVIFRLRGRDVIHQNLVAIGMLLLYMVLVPIVFLASIVPSAIVTALHASGGGAGFSGLLIHLIGLAAAFIVALILFSAIYIVVPNRPVHFYEVWKGTLVAAALLVLYEIVFPIYESVALRPNNYGSVAAFAIVILVFFYYLALILLVGAEVNSWASGQRETASDIAAVLHEVQAHNTTRGAAGSTAGSPQEDMATHEGNRAVASSRRVAPHERTNHRADSKPETVQPGQDGRQVQAVARAHRRRNQRALGIAALAGVAAAAFWLQRRGG